MKAPIAVSAAKIGISVKSLVFIFIVNSPLIL
nr:MAG TPA: hypothetical protein [Caudoviricetes sp.]